MRRQRGTTNHERHKMSNPVFNTYMLGAIEYKAVGHVSILTVFGFSVYKRVGDVKWLLGLVWGK